MDGQLSAEQMLDQAQHFFDSWKVEDLTNSWNEEYGQYIVHIDEPDNVAGLDSLNLGLPNIDVVSDDDEPSQPIANANNGPFVRNWYPVCAVCYNELDHDNWWISFACFHCFCEGCIKRLKPERRENESDAEYEQRRAKCHTCRTPSNAPSNALANQANQASQAGQQGGQQAGQGQRVRNLADLEIAKIFPNYVVYVVDNPAPATTQAAASQSSQPSQPSQPSQSSQADEANRRRAENRQIVADLVYTNNHRRQAEPNTNWDTLEDEMDLEDFDLSQPHSQFRSQRGQQSRGTGRARPRGRGGRGGRGRARARGSTRGTQVEPGSPTSQARRHQDPLHTVIRPRRARGNGGPRRPRGTRGARGRGFASQFDAQVLTGLLRDDQAAASNSRNGNVSPTPGPSHQREARRAAATNYFDFSDDDM